MPTTLAPPPSVKPATPPASETSDASGLGPGWDSQVVLFNDDVNTFQHVAACLVEVFGHPRDLAESIMMEAHWRGRAIAEVEARKPAEAHAAALRARGLKATVESVDGTP